MQAYQTTRFDESPEYGTPRGTFPGAGFADPEAPELADCGSDRPVEDYDMTPGTELHRIQTIAESHLRRLYALAPDVSYAEVKALYPVVRRPDGRVEITEAWSACVVVGDAMSADCITAAGYAATVAEAVADCVARYAEQVAGQRAA